MTKSRTVEVKRVVDGDTFVTSSGETIRLANVDAPELGTPGGISARKRLQRAVAGKIVCIYPKLIDRYGRTIAAIAPRDCAFAQ